MTTLRFLRAIALCFQVPIVNDWAENLIGVLALGRKNWLFAGAVDSGERAAAIMSLIQCASRNSHDPYAYLKDVPAQRASEVGHLLPALRKVS